VREFAARWVCEGETPAEPAVGAEPAAESAQGDTPPSKNGNVMYVSFTLNCTQENWTPITLQSFCLPYEGNRVFTCEQMGYPAGTQGNVIVQEKTTCPTGVTTRSLVKNDCVGERPIAEQPADAVVDAAPEAPAASPPAAVPSTRPKRTKPLVGQ
jgi:hypothetical protein